MPNLRIGAARAKQALKRRLDRALVAPAPDPAATGTGRPVVAGLLTSSSGLGRAARMTFRALEACGFDPCAIDLTEAFAAHRSDVDFNALAPGDDGGPLILQLNAPETPRALRALGSDRLRGRYRVGYWVYELDPAPSDWAACANLVNEIWSPSRFAAGAIAASVGQPVTTVRHPVAMVHKDAALRERDTFVIGCAADARSSLARKNPLAAIAAFQKAFPDDETVRVRVHITGESSSSAFGAIQDAARRDPRIVISTQPFSDDDMSAFIASCSVWLSMHRTEGFGLTMAEALLSGVPVVATAGTGSADFEHLAGMHPVAGSDVAVEDPAGPTRVLTPSGKSPISAQRRNSCSACARRPWMRRRSNRRRKLTLAPRRFAPS